MMKRWMILLALLAWPCWAWADSNVIEGDPVIISEGNLELGNDTTQTINSKDGTLKFFDTDDEYCLIDTANISASFTLTLPVDDGDPGEFLKTDGSGNTSWDAVASFWKRTGTLLEPATANDVVSVSSNSDYAIIGTTSSASAQCAGVKGSAGSSGLAPGTNIGVWGDNDNGPGVVGFTAGETEWAIWGRHEHATGAGVGVLGYSASSNNAAYGGHFDRELIDGWTDYTQRPAHPASPLATCGRTWLADGSTNAWEDHKLMLTDEGGNVHDLTCQMKQCWDGAELATELSGITYPYWVSQIHSGSTITPAIATTANVAYDFTNNQWDAADGVWTWTAQHRDSPHDDQQNDIAIRTGSFRKFGDGADRAGNCRIIVKARVKLSSDTHFDSVKLFLCDASADNSSTALSADFKASASGAWYEATLAAAGTDVGGWTSNLRAGVVAIGKTMSGTVGAQITRVQVDWISVEQWVD